MRDASSSRSSAAAIHHASAAAVSDWPSCGGWRWRMEAAFAWSGAREERRSCSPCGQRRRRRLLPRCNVPDRRILVVEDEESLVLTLRDRLVSEGYTGGGAMDGDG